MTRQPLAGIRIIEVATFIAAPAAATAMADFGAEVIKVEPPSGDPYRTFAQLPGMPTSDLNYPWLLDARNKKSVVLDLHVPEARMVLRTLVARADVFITNLLPASLSRLELTFSDLVAIRPELVYASVSGYGAAGPEAGRPGYDVNAWWARSGLMDLLRSPGGSPLSSVPGMGDHATAVALFGAIMLGLYYRDQVGRGIHVTTSLMANGVWANALQIQAMLCGAVVQPRPPRDQAPNPLANRYQARDGRWFVLTLLQESRDWPRFVRAVGDERLAEDPRFATTPARRAHARELIRELDRIFAGKDWSAWREILAGNDFPCECAYRVDELCDDAQLRDAGSIVPLRVGTNDTALRTIASPFDIVGQPKREAEIAPELGEHTESVLREVGLSEDDIHRLACAGAHGQSVEVGTRTRGTRRVEHI